MSICGSRSHRRLTGPSFPDTPRRAGNATTRHALVGGVVRAGPAGGKDSCHWFPNGWFNSSPPTKASSGAGAIRAVTGQQRGGQNDRPFKPPPLDALPSKNKDRLGKMRRGV